MSEIKSVKNLAKATSEEVCKFVSSFDRVYCDVDGVLWLNQAVFPGAVKCISTLRKLDKQILFVSNNSAIALKLWPQKLDLFEAKEQDIITPTHSVIWYLKKLQIEKEIFVVGMRSFKNELKEAGFTLADDGELEDDKVESLAELTEVISKYDASKVGAVVLDIDINLNYVKLLKSVKYLQNKDVVFLSGASDKRIPFRKEFAMIGPYYFVNAVEELVGRKSVGFAKPSTGLREMILQQEKIDKPERILFIGDSIDQDMRFASECGFQKLLVLTGITKEDQVLTWTHPEEYKPEYYIDSLESFNELIV